MSDLYHIDAPITGSAALSYHREPTALVAKNKLGAVVGLLVKVEPTDSICTFHNHVASAGATSCFGMFVGAQRDCVMVDVVRIGDET